MKNTTVPMTPAQLELWTFINKDSLEGILDKIEELIELQNMAFDWDGKVMDMRTIHRPELAAISNNYMMVMMLLRMAKERINSRG